VHFPGSIMFVNIDEGLPEQAWEQYIRGIQESPETRESRLGIVSYNTDQGLMKKYLMEISIPCGYIHLKLGALDSTRIILDALAVNEARGKRRYIRAFCEQENNVTLNYKGPDNTMYYGKLLDISVAGAAAKIENFSAFPPNTKLRNVQFRLRGALFLADVILMGQRRNDRNIYILIFDPAMREESKLLIHRFIKQTIQRDMDLLKV
jgi:hypothetical protein